SGDVRGRPHRGAGREVDVKELMPGFWDRKVCAHCGAPAHAVGTLVKNSDGTEEYRKTPMVLAHKSVPGYGTIEVTSLDVGAIGMRGPGDSARYGLVYTHECAGDLLGGRSCGLLPESAVRPCKGEMPDVCWYELGDRLTIDEMRETMREPV
ncbi:MAG: hypothetical protein ABFC80_09535, partial [Coriobacteriales bacterium]